MDLPPNQEREHKVRVDTAALASDRAWSDTERMRSAVRQKIRIPHTLEDGAFEQASVAPEATCGADCALAEKSLLSCAPACVTQRMRDQVCATRGHVLLCKKRLVLLVLLGVVVGAVGSRILSTTLVHSPAR